MTRLTSEVEGDGFEPSKHGVRQIYSLLPLAARESLRSPRRCLAGVMCLSWLAVARPELAMGIEPITC